MYENVRTYYMRNNIRRPKDMLRYIGAISAAYARWETVAKFGPKEPDGQPRQDSMLFKKSGNSAKSYIMS